MTQRILELLNLEFLKLEFPKLEFPKLEFLNKNTPTAQKIAATKIIYKPSSII